MIGGRGYFSDHSSGGGGAHSVEIRGMRKVGGFT